MKSKLNENHIEIGYIVLLLEIKLLEIFYAANIKILIRDQHIVQFLFLFKKSFFF